MQGKIKMSIVNGYQYHTEEDVNYIEYDKWAIEWLCMIFNFLFVVFFILFFIVLMVG
jgi:hypothetical protein